MGYVKELQVQPCWFSQFSLSVSSMAGWLKAVSFTVESRLLRAVLLYLTDIIAQDAVFLQGKKKVPKEDLYFRCLIEDD